MNDQIIITWKDIEKHIGQHIEEIKALKVDSIYGIPRGGLVIAVILSHHLGIPMILSFDEVLLYKKHNKKVLIVDELSDTGHTLKLYDSIIGFPTFTIYIRTGTGFIPTIWCEEIKTKNWLKFPWEF